jgi:hypothetical protein
MMTANLDPHDTIEIHMSEYEKLMDADRKLKSIKSLWDEYQMRRKLLGERITEGNMHRLRRRTLNKMGQLLQGNFNA